MYRHWEDTVKPLLEDLVPPVLRVVEVGVFRGWNTAKIIEWLKEKPEAKPLGKTGPVLWMLTIVEPMVRYEILEQVKRNLPHVVVWNMGSLEALNDPNFKKHDVIILDGDHNYYTLYNELRIINERKLADIILIHDTVENGTRDYYEDPEAIPDEFLNKVEKTPGWSDKDGQYNGLCQAISDFLVDHPGWIYKDLVDEWPGLGMLNVL